MNVKTVTHLVSVSLSWFESTTVGNGVEVGDESDNLRSKDLTALSVRILLDGLSVVMDECDGRESIVIVCGYQSRCLSAQAVWLWQLHNVRLPNNPTPGLFFWSCHLGPLSTLLIIHWKQKVGGEKIYLHETAKYSDKIDKKSKGLDSSWIEKRSHFNLLHPSTSFIR